MQWVLVVICCLASLRTAVCSHTPGQVAKSRHFGNTMLPMEHREGNNNNGELTEQLDTDSQSSFPTNEFRLSYPLHEFGSPFYSNFNRPDFEYPTPNIKAINIPQYDDEFNYFKKPTRNYHIRHEYEDKGCRRDKDEKPNFSSSDDFSKREPNFHQRFDPGPNGFGPLGRKPEMNADTNFFKQPILHNDDNHKPQDNNEKKVLKPANPFDYSHEQKNPFKQFAFALHPSPMIPFSNRNNNFGLFNNRDDKQFDDDTNSEATDKESNKELKQYTPKMYDRGEEDNKSSQDRYSRRQGAGWHPSRA